MIRVEELSKYYGRRAAVSELSFQADKSEIIGFLGPNGAGKTTTMRILSGYMPPTSGSAEVAGFDVIEDSMAVRERVGYLPETVPLYEDMTLYDYLKFMADIRRVEYAEERVDEVIEQVELEDRSDSFISSLSKGMRQRVGLAQAMIHEPDVLILDEPTIGLDPGQIIKVRELIRKLGETHTVLLSTHILSEAQQMCDRVLIINKGKIVAEDSPERLQQHLAGNARMSVTVAGDDDGVLAVIRGVSGVEDAIAKDGGVVEFQPKLGKELRPRVAKALIESGYDLLELKSLGMSLEDIFLELTRDEPLPPEMDGTVDEPEPEPVIEYEEEPVDESDDSDED
jgi:ABC-2 type transport system ATP-binding protein